MKQMDFKYDGQRVGKGVLLMNLKKYEKVAHKK